LSSCQRQKRPSANSTVSINCASSEFIDSRLETDGDPRRIGDAYVGDLKG